MKRHDTEKEIFSASLNLQMSHVDKESYERCNTIISHSSKTVSMLVGAGVICVVLWFIIGVNDGQPVDTLYPLIPVVLFLIVYARYKHLHKQSLEIIKKLNKSSEPAV